jgi:hypothetical protein
MALYMRCNNCRKKIDNPNLLRCPYCGKTLKKRKDINSYDLALNISFITVMVAFVVFSFLSYFFTCEYYSIPVMIIAGIVVTVAIPFVHGNFENMPRKAVDVFAAITSIPFIVNWLVVFIGNSESLDRGGLFSSYYISVMAAIVACDVILILRAFDVIKKGHVFCWIALALGILAAGFSIFFYNYLKLIKPFAIAIIAVQAFTYPYMAFHVLIKENSRR